MTEQDEKKREGNLVQMALTAVRAYHEAKWSKPEDEVERLREEAEEMLRLVYEFQQRCAES